MSKMREFLREGEGFLKDKEGGVRRFEGGGRFEGGSTIGEKK